jgi:hypothetical protein
MASAIAGPTAIGYVAFWPMLTHVFAVTFTAKGPAQAKPLPGITMAHPIRQH